MGRQFAYEVTQRQVEIGEHSTVVSIDLHEKPWGKEVNVWLHSHLMTLSKGTELEMSRFITYEVLFIPSRPRVRRRQVVTDIVPLVVDLNGCCNFVVRNYNRKRG